MTIEEAYDEVFLKHYPDQYSSECLETPNYYIFCPRPIGSNPDEIIYSGTTFPAVDRMKNQVVLLDITEIDLSNAVRRKIIMGED